MANVEVLVVAGGGSGGIEFGGGGGGGGIIYKSGEVVAAGDYPIVVGAGGASVSSRIQGNSGNNSTAFGNTAFGGGGGGMFQSVGSDGGSGGGGGGRSTSVGGSATQTGTDGYGYGGGTAISNGNDGGGGGGGAGLVGGDASGVYGGDGGNGFQSSITGTSTYYAGGGGGGTDARKANSIGGAGGLGGGGDGAGNGTGQNADGQAGTANTGGGGGGGSISNDFSGAGGSGIVIISYATDGSDGIDPSSTGGTKTTSGGQTIHTFTADGTFTAVEAVVVAPTVTASAATSITSTTADANGEITATGGEDATERGFVYDTTSQTQPGDVSPATSSYGSVENETGTFGTGTYSLGLTGLTKGTTYYVRAYAKNTEGYAYSAGEVSFATPTPATSPGTMANDTAVGTEAWSGVDNAKASDDNRASNTSSFNDPVLPFITNYLKATNFGFEIPTGATINGILVEIERSERSGDGSVYDSEVKIVKADGSIGTTNKADTATDWPAEAYYPYGGATDLWGETWTASDINDADFGTVLAANVFSGTFVNAAVDHIRITVYYTGAPTITGASTITGISTITF